MSEYEIIGIVFIGLTSIFTLVGTISKPVNKLTNAVTRLDENVKAIKKEFDLFVCDNKNTHERLWRSNDELRDARRVMEKTVTDHERRLSTIEEKLEKEER